MPPDFTRPAWSNGSTKALTVPSSATSITALEAVEEIIGAVLDISRLDTGALKPEVTVFRLDDIARRPRRRIRAACPQEGHRFPRRPDVAGRPLRPEAAPPAAPEPRLQCDQIHPHRSRPRRLPAAGTGRGSVGLRHRLGIPSANGGGSSRSSIASTTRPEKPAASVSACRSSSAFRASSTTRSRSCRRRGAARISRSPCRSRRPPSVPSKAPVEAISTGRGSPGRMVLCIDNEPQILDGLETLLAGWGCTVLTARSAADAEAAVGAAPRLPDISIVDYHLDAGDGVAAMAIAARALRLRSHGRPHHRRPVAGREGGGAARGDAGPEQAGPARRAPCASAHDRWRPAALPPSRASGQRFVGGDGHWPASMREAAMTAWVRLSTPSFCRIAET